MKISQNGRREIMNRLKETNIYFWGILGKLIPGDLLQNMFLVRNISKIKLIETK